MKLRLPKFSLTFSICFHLSLLLLCFAPISSAQDLEAEVVDILQRSCARAGCHAAPMPQEQMNLEEDHFYADLVGEPSIRRPEFMRVKPGDPDSSYIIKKLRGDPDIFGSQMPLIGEKLSEDEIQTIENWISSLDEVDAARKQGAPDVAPLAFSSWKAINLPTTRGLDAGNFLFLISHRFNPKLSDGYDALFGLDGSGIIYLHLGYSITDDLLVALARSNSSDNVELQGRYRIMEQGGEKNWPVGLSVIATGNWVSEKAPGESRYRPEAFKFTGQLAVTRALSDWGGIAFVPGILVNPAENVDGEDPMITLGIAGRWRFYRNFAIIGEWVPIVSGFTRTLTFGNEIRFDSWGGGIEIATGGHTFQVVLSNSVGLTSDQYLRGGDLDIRDGHVRLGFNIYRILN